MGLTVSPKGMWNLRSNALGWFLSLSSFAIFLDFQFLLTTSARILHTYAMSSKDAFTPAEKKKIRGYLTEQTINAEGDPSLPDELEALKEAVKETTE